MERKELVKEVILSSGEVEVFEDKVKALDWFINYQGYNDLGMELINSGRRDITLYDYVEEAYSSRFLVCKNYTISSLHNELPFITDDTRALLDTMSYEEIKAVKLEADDERVCLVSLSSIKDEFKKRNREFPSLKERLFERIDASIETGAWIVDGYAGGIKLVVETVLTNNEDQVIDYLSGNKIFMGIPDVEKYLADKTAEDILHEIVPLLYETPEVRESKKPVRCGVEITHDAFNLKWLPETSYMNDGRLEVSEVIGDVYDIEDVDLDKIPALLDELKAETDKFVNSFPNGELVSLIIESGATDMIKVVAKHLGVKYCYSVQDDKVSLVAVL